MEDQAPYAPPGCLPFPRARRLPDPRHAPMDAPDRHPCAEAPEPAPFDAAPFRFALSALAEEVDRARPGLVWGCLADALRHAAGGDIRGFADAAREAALYADAPRRAGR